jgi:hypothetical protein
MSTASYDPETIETLQRALDLAWDGLAPERRLRTSRLDLAERILVLAARGERDLARLTACALVEPLSAGDTSDLSSPPLQLKGTAAP